MAVAIAASTIPALFVCAGLGFAAGCITKNWFSEASASAICPMHTALVTGIADGDTIEVEGGEESCDAQGANDETPTGFTVLIITSAVTRR